MKLLNFKGCKTVYTLFFEGNRNQHKIESLSCKCYNTLARKQSTLLKTNISRLKCTLESMIFIFQWLGYVSFLECNYTSHHGSSENHLPDHLGRSSWSHRNCLFLLPTVSYCYWLLLAKVQLFRISCHWILEKLQIFPPKTVWPDHLGSNPKRFTGVPCPQKWKRNRGSIPT